MRLIKRLRCWLGIHSPLAGIDPAKSLYWICSCGAIRDGAFAARQKKR